MSVDANSIRRPARALALLALLALSLAALLIAPPHASLARQPLSTTTDTLFRSLRLVIAYGDDVEKHYNLLRWTSGMTVLDALTLARDKPPPLGLPFLSVGADDSAFVRSIDGLTNEGGRPGDRNWIYKINDQTADRSCGLATLQPGDTISWLYLPITPHTPSTK